MDSSDIWAVIIFAVSLAFGFIGKKKDLPQNPNVPDEDGFPAELGEEYEEPWIYSERENETDAPAASVAAFGGESYDRPAAFLDPQNEGVRSTTATTQPSTPPSISQSRVMETGVSLTRRTAEPMRTAPADEDAYAIHDDAPQNNQDWRRAIIAYEILNRKY